MRLGSPRTTHEFVVMYPLEQPRASHVPKSREKHGGAPSPASSPPMLSPRPPTPRSQPTFFICRPHQTPAPQSRRLPRG